MKIITRKSKPAVNVKIYKGSDSAMSNFMAEEGRNQRFPDYYETELQDEDRQDAYSQAIDIGWDRLQEIASDIFSEKVKVWSEGRSNGWAVVGGLGDVEEWEEGDYVLWGEFERQARATADDIPYMTLAILYDSQFEEMIKTEEEQASIFIASLEANNCKLVNE